MAAKKKAQVQTAPGKRPVGRPVGSGSYSKELADEICQRLSEGEPLAQICRSPNMPDRTTVWDWTQKDPGFAQRIAQARDDGWDAIALDGLRIVDDTDEDPSSRRVRADYRLKLLAKWDPKRYGDKIDIQQTTRIEPVSADQMADEMRQSPALRREIEAMLAKSTES